MTWPIRRWAERALRDRSSAGPQAAHERRGRHDAREDGHAISNPICRSYDLDTGPTRPTRRSPRSRRSSRSTRTTFSTTSMPRRSITTWNCFRNCRATVCAGCPAAHSTCPRSPRPADLDGREVARQRGPARGSARRHELGATPEGSSRLPTLRGTSSVRRARRDPRRRTPGRGTATAGIDAEMPTTRSSGCASCSNRAEQTYGVENPGPNNKFEWECSTQPLGSALD